MTDGCGNAFLPSEIQCHDAHIVEGQLDFANGLLGSYATSYGAVHLVGQPILTGYCLELKYFFKVGEE